MMYVYVDLFLGLNILINSVILFLTAKLCGASIRWCRIFLAAGAGGMYALGAVCLDSHMMYSTVAKLFVSVILVRIAFSAQTPKSMLQLTAAYYAVCFVTGGAVAGWYFYRQSVLSSVLQPFDRLLGWDDLVGGAMLAVGLVLFVKAGYLTHLLCRSVEYDLSVIYRERTVSLKAILDTGNTLYSIGGKPVIVADYRAMKDLLSKDAASFFSQYPPQEWLENIHLCKDKEWLARIQVIPFRDLGGNHVLIGFRPDIVRVNSSESIVETTEVIIGVYAGTLSHEKRYCALLHPAILQLSVHKEVKTCVSPG